jgi:hypothetical protein
MLVSAVTACGTRYGEMYDSKQYTVQQIADALGGVAADSRPQP